MSIFSNKFFKHVDLIFAVVFITLYILIGSLNANIFSRIDNNILDNLQKFTEYKTRQENISIVAIDTKSIDKIGRWPWSRDKMAQLVRVLNEYYGVKVIAFDITFSEVDKNFDFLSDGMNTFKKLINQEPGISSELSAVFDEKLKSVIDEKNTDREFADELKKWDNVILGYLFIQNLDELKHLSKEEVNKQILSQGSLSVIKGGDNWAQKLPQAAYIEANIPLFLENTNTQIGFFTIQPDSDGIVRKNNLVMLYSGTNTLYPSLDLQILRMLSKNEDGFLPQVSVNVNESGIQEFKITHETIDSKTGDIQIQEKLMDVNADGTVHINYKGYSRTYPTYSFYDILNKEIPQEKLKDNIILVGVTEIGVFDIRATPLENAFPGVEIHANVIDNLIRGDAYTFKDVNQWLTYALLFFFAVVVITLSRKAAFHKTLLTLIFMLVAFIVGNIYILFNHYTWLAFSPILIFVSAEIFLISFSKYFLEQKEKFFIKDTFKKYLSPTLIEHIIKNPSLLKLGGEKRDLTIFFSDIKGFTAISENMESAELIELINEYFEYMSNIVLDNKGTVGKYIGDGIMAFFGAPTYEDDHAMDCCLTAIQMQLKLEELRKKWLELGKPEIVTRIGINTGTIIVGNMGSSLRMEYTVMGDAVNIAARLESINKVYGTSTIISEFTYELVRDRVVARELDNTKVVGKQQAIRLYELIGLTDKVPEETQAKIDMYHDGLALFRQQKWDDALEKFNVSLKDDNPILLNLYRGRCEKFKVKPPPENWNGVFVMMTK